MPNVLRRTVALAVTLTVGTACASSGSGSTPAPRPVPAPPPPVVAPPPAAAPNVAPPAPHPFAYAAGTYRYEIRSDAVITALNDPRVDSVSTRAVVTYHIVRGDSGTITVDGSVDTFTVVNSRVPGSSLPVSSGIPFTMTALVDGRLENFGNSDSASVCATPVSAIVSAGREILAALPVPLMPAAEWTDSATTITCRAALPMIARTVRRSRAVWASVPQDWSRQSGDVAFEVARTTTTVVSGQGRAAGRQVDLSGQGQGSSLLYVDPELGILLGGTGNGSTKIVVDAGSQRQEFVQTVHQQVRLLR